jgi:hypothetical protein
MVTTAAAPANGVARHRLGVDVFMVGQIAGMLGVSPRTVARWCDGGGLRCWLMPGAAGLSARRVWRADLLDFARREGLAAVLDALGPADAVAPLPPPSPRGQLRRGVDVFTTGMVAGMLGVSPRTVSAWCDSGQMRSWRVPPTAGGSADRRVWRADLLDFCRAHGPRPVLDFLDPGGPPALCGLPDSLRAALTIAGAVGCPDLFTLGAACARDPRPRAVVLGGCHGRAEALAAVRVLATLAPRPLLVGVHGEDDDGSAWAEAGCDRVFGWPCDPARVLEALTDG